MEYMNGDMKDFMMLGILPFPTLVKVIRDPGRRPPNMYIGKIGELHMFEPDTGHYYLKMKDSGNYIAVTPYNILPIDLSVDPKLYYFNDWRHGEDEPYRLREDVVLYLAKKIFESLKCLNDNGYAYIDLRLDNILYKMIFDPDSENFELKLVLQVLLLR